MLREVLSLESAINAWRLDSVSSTGDDDCVRGTTVVVICSLGEHGETGEMQRTGCGAFNTGCGSSRDLTGNFKRPTLIVRVGLVLGAGGEATTTTEFSSAGFRRKGGRRAAEGDALRGLGTTCPVKRAEIWSSDGMALRLLNSGADFSAVFGRIPLGKRKSTCSTQGEMPSSAEVFPSPKDSASNNSRGDSRPGDGRE